jgi:hypothetical protein
VVRWTNDGPGRSPGAGDAQGSAAVGHRRPVILVAVAVVAVVVAIIALLVRPATGSAESSPRTMAPATTTPAAPTTTAAPSAAQIGSPADAAALQELEVVAAGLTTPVVLTSPAEWDRWAGTRPTYPGDRDIDGCPVMASRLGDALGMPFSYWSGTLPQHPYGCYYAPIPLHYDGSSYPYVVSVGRIADGRTEGLSLARRAGGR